MTTKTVQEFYAKAESSPEIGKRIAKLDANEEGLAGMVKIAADAGFKISVDDIREYEQMSRKRASRGTGLRKVDPVTLKKYLRESELKRVGTGTISADNSDTLDPVMRFRTRGFGF